MLDEYPLHLVYAELNQGRIVSGTVRPVINQHLALQALDCKQDQNGQKNYLKAEKKFSFYKTDNFGRISTIDENGEKAVTFATGVVGAKKKIQLLPHPIIEACAYLSPDDPAKNTWKKRVSSLLENELKTQEEIVLSTAMFSGNDVNNEAFNHLSTEERKIFNQYFLKDRKYSGIVIPVLRHLIILLPSNTYRIASMTSSNTIEYLKQLKMKNASFLLPSATQTQQNKIEIFSATLSLPKDQLPEGIYTITVSNPSGSYYNSKTGQNTNQYTLSFKADFKMQTTIGDMDIISGFPITVEETMLMHYPAEYEHLQSALMSFVKYEGGGNNEPFKQAENVLKKAVEVAKVIKEKNDFIKDRIEYEKKDFFDDLFTTIGRESQQIKDYYTLTKSYLSCKKNLKTIYDTWKVNTAIFKAVDASSVLSDVRKLYYCVLGAGIYDKYGDEMIKHALSRQIVNKEHAFKLLSSKNEQLKMDFLLNTDGPYKKLLEVQKSAYAKTLGGVDLAFSAYDTFLAFSSLWDLAADKKEELVKYTKLVDQIASLNLSSGSREINATITKTRIGLDKTAQGYDAAKIKAIRAAFDLMCGIGAMTPAAPVLSVLRLLVETADGLKMTFTNTLDLIEQTMPDTIVAQVWQRTKIMNVLNADMRTNYAFLTDRSALNSFNNATAQDIYVQSRIYSETMRGLMALIQRISCRLYNKAGSNKGIDYAAFDAKVKEYKINEYINTFIFSRGWLVPQHIELPVGLDTLWSYMNWESGSNTYAQACKAGVMPSGYSTACYYGVKPATAGKIPANHWEADFQKHFPVHAMQSRDVFSLAHIFSKNYTGAEKFLRWTQIYYRQQPDPVKPMGVNEGWMPLIDIAHTPDAITTKTQLRIVIVFDSGVDIRAVPMTIKLNRVETFKDISGPEYKIMPMPLSMGDGGLIPGEEAYKGKLGVVLFPFYMFGGELKYGVRPLECPESAWGILTQAMWKKSVQEQNLYAFSVKIGAAMVPVLFNTGFVDFAANGTLYSKLNVFTHNNDFFTFFGRQTFLFRLNPSDKNDETMIRIKTFLYANTYAEKNPSIPAKTARTGVSGIYIHNGQNGEFYPAAGWIVENGNPRIKDIPQHIQTPAYCTASNIRITVVLYITAVNEVEFARNKSYMRSWAESPCQLGINRESLLNIGDMLSDKPMQIIPGTLHFLGYATAVKTEGKIGFKLRKIRSSVRVMDNNQVTVDMEKNTFDEIEETPTFRTDLNALLKWGIAVNFDKHLFADPGLYWESAFFAADFSLFWDNDGRTVNGFAKTFKSGDTAELHVSAQGGWDAVFKRKLIIP